jgi:hypothetical protein
MLKLAECNEDGKLKRFLELGRRLNHFIYFGDGISYIEENKEQEFPWIEHTFSRDEKDPLNRFNGLFDGRTYGGGKFVLISTVCAEKDSLLDGSRDIYRKENFAWLDEVIEVGYCDSGDNYYEREIVLVKADSSNKLHHNNYDSYGGPRFELIGNLHENPELWEKVRND